MLCSAPSSVTVKSFALNPSTALPLLSFTFTVSITNWLLVEKVAGLAPAAGAFSPIFWALEGGAAASANKRRAIVARIMLLKPHYKTRRQAAHGIGCRRKTELRAAERGVPTRKRDVVDGVGGINPQVAAQPVIQPEREIG